jgi:hypothetical protein
VQDPNVLLAILGKSAEGKLESRTLGNLYIRFGGEFSETWRGNTLRRTVLTLLSLGTHNEHITKAAKQGHYSLWSSVAPLPSCVRLVRPWLFSDGAAFGTASLFLSRCAIEVPKTLARKTCRQRLKPAKRTRGKDGAQSLVQGGPAQAAVIHIQPDLPRLVQQ